MYEKYFGLAEAPFSIAPDPRFLYLSQRHQEALAHLLYGVKGDGGFVLLTGEVGSGKTTLCRCLLEQIPDNCDVAYIFNPKLTVEELLSTFCSEIGICYPPGNHSIKVFIDFINSHLLRAHAKGRRIVLIIDEAQNLAVEVLEQMRLLTNLETNQRKLLQIILIGQPELATLLDRRELRQLSQRIVARYHLGPLCKKEVAAYVSHRLEVSWGKRQLIPERLTGRLYRLSGGVPRVINVLCDRALLGAYVQRKERVDKATLEQAARETLHQTPKQQGAKRLYALSASLILAMALALALPIYQQRQSAEMGAIVPSVSAKAAAPNKPPEKAPVATTAAKAEVALLDTLEWPKSQATLPASRPLAYAALFQTWDMDYRQGTDVCHQARSVGLRCYSGRGGLDDLRKLNRPAVLQMRTAEGNDFHVTLTALGDNSASFSLGDQIVTTSLAALASQWSGQYTLLWRPPLQMRSNLRPGERGTPVQWLAGQLAIARGQPADSGKDPIFDEGLVRELKQFQLAHGLIPTGALEPQTIMYLAGVGDQKAPKLSFPLNNRRMESKPSGIPNRTDKLAQFTGNSSASAENPAALARQGNQ
ncbi:MAG: peptidoglycan-binding domain 1 [Proteobacteria bacterium]|nr:peptidoglycan-binding domain 1 [Pseudomonadota bacterium]